MSVEQAWPPPVDTDTEWMVLNIGPMHQQQQARVRRVALWGEQRWVSEDGEVFCDYCGQMVNILELGRAGNGHGISPAAVGASVGPMMREVS